MKIHIKEKNKGKFTSYCGGKVTQSCINRAKKSGNKTLIKRATFAENARHFKHNKGGILKANDGLKFYNTKLNYNPHIQPQFRSIQPFVDNQRNPVVNLHVVRFNPETGDAENNAGEGYSLALPELTVYGDKMKEKMSHVPYQQPESESTWAQMGKHSKDAEKYWSPEYGWQVFNTMTLGAPNRLSVSQDLRFIKDLFNPKLTATQKADSWIQGNEGIFENPLYNMALDMASGAGIEGAIQHISSKPTLYRNLYRKGVKQLTAKKRLNNLINKVEQQKTNIDQAYKQHNEIVNKVTKEEIPLINRPSKANPINLNINPNKIKQAWKKLYTSNFSGEEIQVANIDGKPTAYVVNQSYNPNTIVNTGKYKIPNFNTGEYIEGDLNLHTSDETITTADGRIIPTGSGSRNVYGAAPLRQVLNDNYNFVVQHIPGFKGFGSSVGVKEGALNHITHDIDGYISKENLDEFAKTHNINRGYSNDTFWYELNNGQYGDAGHIDLNVIDINPKTGVGNDRAKELYRQFFPKEYRHSVERSASDPNHEIYITDLNNVPLTNQQLIDKFDPLTKTIMDSFEIDFDGYNKAKHAGRALEYLAGDNPKAVRKALEQTAKELSQNGEMNALLPTMKFGNLDENIKTLNSIGYKGDLATIAKDPQKMQNVLDYWALTKGKTFNRVFGPGNIDEKVGTAKKLNRNAIEWNYTDKGSGGHAAGAFLNTIRGSKPLNDFKYSSILIPHIDLPQGIKANDIINKVRYANGARDVLIKDKAQLSEILQKSFKNNRLQQDILNTPNLTFQELLSKLPSSGEEVNNFGKLFNQKFHINAIQGDTYNNYYSGVIAPMNNPKDSYSLFYRFHGLPDWDSRMQKFNIDSTQPNPFDVLRNHKTEPLYIYMPRDVRNVNRYDKYDELQRRIYNKQIFKNHKHSEAINTLNKRIKMAKSKINKITYKKNNIKKNTKIGLVASSFPTGIASLAIANQDLNEQDRYNMSHSPKSQVINSYFSKMYDKAYEKARTKEVQDSIADQHMEQYEALKDSYLQLKKQIDQAKAKIPRNKYGTPKFDSPEYLTWKRLQQIAIQEGYLPEDYVPDYNFE